MHHPAEQANSEFIRVIEDKPVPHDMCFAKKALVDSIGQRNSHVKTCSCGGLLDETDIYSKGKNICF